jgi:hypothetical protein
MYPNVEIMAEDVTAKASQNSAAQLVLAKFSGTLPDRKLLAIFDNEDCQSFKHKLGKENRGFFSRAAKRNYLCPAWSYWPEYLQELLVIPNPASMGVRYIYDGVVYLHWSTCDSKIGSTITFAHELQHFRQYGFNRRLWAWNTVIANLVGAGLKTIDLPIEIQARITAKRIAKELHGDDAAAKYIDEKARTTSDIEDSEDWRFVSRLDSSIQYNLEKETRCIVRSLDAYREDIENILYEVRNDDDFKDLKCTDYFNAE